ncbi:MAG: hypothetical protein HY606_00625, partial [Planctomycetes bacterium]|nr:hypothetical protein [Planctomycetota bacterium]
MRKKKIFNSVVLMTIFIVWFNAYSAAETTKNNFFPRFLLCAMEVDDLRQDMDFDKEFKRIKEHNMNMVSAFWRIGGESQTEKNREKAERFFKKAEEYGIR